MTIELPDRPPDHEIIWPDESGLVTELQFTGGVTLPLSEGFDPAVAVLTGSEPYLTVNLGQRANYFGATPTAPLASLMVMEVRVMTELLPGSGERDSRFEVDFGSSGAGTSFFSVAARAEPPFAPEQWAITYNAGRSGVTTSGVNHWRYVMRVGPRGGEWESSESPEWAPIGGDMPAPQELRAWPPSNLSLWHRIGNQPRPRLYAVNLWYESARGGVPPLRQRQNALNSGGPPLRHRQNGGQSGGPLLRHRQNGI